MAADAIVRPFRRVSPGIEDPKLQIAVRLLEDKLIEMDQRLRDIEKRVTDGGL